jgi:DNA-binding NarL/FixJ family response regulator
MMIEGRLACLYYGSLRRAVAIISSPLRNFERVNDGARVVSRSASRCDLTARSTMSKRKSGPGNRARMNKKISVLLVDDHVLVRRGLRRLLEDEPTIDVVGEARDGLEAVKMAGELEPSVVLMDFALPGMNGLDATRTIVSSGSNSAVIMLSMHTEDVRVRQALEAGARGYIFKDAQGMDLVTEIRRVLDDEAPMVMPTFQPGGRRGRTSSLLTAREIEVLRLIARGKSNREIADDLGLSVNTVSAHRSNMMRTLGIHKAAELVAYAIANGLIDPI